MRTSLAFCSLAFACAAVAAAPEPVSNDALSACVKERIAQHQDRKAPLGEVVEAIWQGCNGDQAQAVLDNPAMADILKLRMRALVTGHRNATIPTPAR